MSSAEDKSAGGQDKRHHVPAASIGYFAEHPVLERLRKSIVAVHRLGPDVTFMTKAENVGFGRDLYRGEMIEGLDNDRYFASFERLAHAPVDAIDASPSGELPADAWVAVAAYITSQFTRAPDLERSLDELAEETGIPRERIDVGYAMNTQRVASAVFRARWEFFRSDNIDFILNDRAIAALRYGDWDMFGYWIPLRKRLGVRLAGGPYPKRLYRGDGSWKIDIPITTIEDLQVENLNRWTWCGAVDEVYGPSTAQLGEVKHQAAPMINDVQDTARHIEGAGLLTLPQSQRRDDEWLLFSLLGGIADPDTEEDERTI
ncbi:MAG TPA: hypothetical protein VIG76_13480 [Amnibacterium sp.]|jgi:hypothetical protein|uniref:hypothetical protein n=1 Tax=Amnibacterium sp. TaxID=1872496 RepID=UPI002F950C42